MIKFQFQEPQIGQKNYQFFKTPNWRQSILYFLKPVLDPSGCTLITHTKMVVEYPPPPPPVMRCRRDVNFPSPWLIQCWAKMRIHVQPVGHKFLNQSHCQGFIWPPKRQFGPWCQSWWCCSILPCDVKTKQRNVSTKYLWPRPLGGNLDNVFVEIWITVWGNELDIGLSVH